MFDPEKLKVCFLAGTLGRGGSERQLVYMLEALRQNGLATRVLCLTQGEPFEKEIIELGISVQHVAREGSSRLGKLNNIIRSLRREPADILQSIHFYTNLYAAVAARVTGAKEIGAIRSNLDVDLRSAGVIGRLNLKVPRHHITNSSTAREQAVARGVALNRIDLIPNVVSIKNENHLHRKNNGTVRLLFVGRLTEEKRADRFLRIVSSIAEQAPGVGIKAAVAGDGPLRPQIESLARTLGLAEKVEMLGERSDMSAVYQQADLLLLTSDLEGTPNVILEAMAHALPVAATKVGGVPVLLGQDRGFMSDPSDEQGLAGAALRLVTNPNLRSELGRVGQEYVKRFHSHTQLHKQLMGIYEKVLSA